MDIHKHSVAAIRRQRVFTQDQTMLCVPFTQLHCIIHGRLTVHTPTIRLQSFHITCFCQAIQGHLRLRRSCSEVSNCEVSKYHIANDEANCQSGISKFDGPNSDICLDEDVITSKGYIATDLNLNAQVRKV